MSFSSLSRLATTFVIPAFVYLFPSNSSAQYVTDNSFMPLVTCTGAPVTVELDIQGIVLYGFSNSSLIRVHLGIGDTIEFYHQLTPTTAYNSAYDTTLSVTYTTTGAYPVYIEVHHPSYGQTAIKNFVHTVTENCSSVTGQVFDDADSNCVGDLNESDIAPLLLLFYNANGSIINMTFTGTSGYYQADIPGSYDSVEVRTSSVDHRQISCAGDSSQILYTTQSMDTADILVECTPSASLHAQHSITGAGAPGDSGLVSFFPWLHASQCKSVGGTVRLVLELDSLIHFNGMLEGEAPDSIQDHRLVWMVEIDSTSIDPLDMLVGDFDVIRISTITDTTAALLEPVYFSVYFTDIPSSLNLDYINGDFWHVDVDGPYDPNNKLVSPQGLADAGYIDPNQRMYYTINFQNTGTAPAQNVYILDTISNHLSLESIRMEDVSHEMMPHIKFDERKLRFSFYDINLPDSTSDPDGSKGYVIFSIEQNQDLSVGTEFKNRVGIYFDYNAPVITNYAVNTIGIPYDTLTVSVFGTDVTCVNNDNGSANAIVSGGVQPYQIDWSNGDTSLSQSMLSPGTYTVSVEDADGNTAEASVQINEDRTNGGPTVDSITVPTPIQAFVEYVHSTGVDFQSSFDWTIEGGALMQDEGHLIRVLWYAGPNGTIYLTKTDSAGCENYSSQDVPILFLGENEIGLSDLSLFPNPVQEQLFIQGLEEGRSMTLRLYDTAGRMVLEQAVRSASTSISVEDLSPGSYVVRLTDGEALVGSAMIVKE